MSGPAMKLVDRGQPRRLSGQEIQELTERRVAARKAWVEAERARRAEERAAWRRSGIRRRRFWGTVMTGLGVVGWTAASIYLTTLEGWVALGYVGALTLTSTAIVLLLRPGRG